jgi:putative sigma-54 modulation protein
VQMPLQVTFRSMAPSDALATHIRLRVDKLERLSERITSCHVVVELAGHHQARGNHYRVTINVGLPGREVLVGRTPSDERAPETAHTTTDRSFDEAERQLEDWVTRQRKHRHDGRRN